MNRRPYFHRGGGCALSLRRLYGLCAVLVLLAGVVLCRTYWVGQQTAYAASAGGQSVQTLTLPRARGDFYDRTGRRLTGLSPQYYALCLPDAAALENPGELATFSFGQGALTVTPLQIAAMMNTVANGGMYRTPAFVQGIVDADGTLTGQTRTADTRTVFDAALSLIHI